MLSDVNTGHVISKSSESCHQFHDIRKPLRDDPKFVRTRLLDPGNPKGTRKDFFSPNIVREFDKHHTRK